MKIVLILLTAIIATPSSFFDFTVKSIDGNKIDFSVYKGKKILIVNTASECGFTGQYKGLQELYEKYKDQLVIIAFPANNFGKQEPGTNEEIGQFCTKNYGVTFPISEKISVKGDNIDPLFKWLTSAENPDFTGSIKWNFEKFLLDENGKLIRRFRSMTKPTGDDLIKAIEEKNMH